MILVGWEKVRDWIGWNKQRRKEKKRRSSSSFSFGTFFFLSLQSKPRSEALLSFSLSFSLLILNFRERKVFVPQLRIWDTLYALPIKVHILQSNTIYICNSVWPCSYSLCMHYFSHFSYFSSYNTMNIQFSALILGSIHTQFIEEWEMSKAVNRLKKNKNMVKKKEANHCANHCKLVSTIESQNNLFKA